MLEDALADSGGAEDQGAVGDGVGDGLVLGGVLEDARRIDCGLGRCEWDGVLVDNAQLGVAEVVHGAGDGADVGGVACADEHDDDAILILLLHVSIVMGLP